MPGTHAPSIHVTCTLLPVKMPSPWFLHGSPTGDARWRDNVVSICTEASLVVLLLFMQINYYFVPSIYDLQKSRGLHSVSAYRHESVYRSMPAGVVHRAQEVSESRGGRPGLSVLNEPYGFRGRKAILNHAHALVSVCP